MRHSCRAAARVAGLALAAALLSSPVMASGPAPVVADDGAPRGRVHAVTTRLIEMPRDECAALAPRGAPTPNGSVAACTAALTVEVDAAPATAGVRGAERLVAASTGCTTTWIIKSLRATVQSVLWGFFWSASANATGYGDSCGRVMWTSVTCDQHGIGYAVSIDWCGAYPGTWAWYGYTSTNMGLNVTVSAVANGTPIAFTHGARNGFNPYTGAAYGFFAW